MEKNLRKPVPGHIVEKGRQLTQGKTGWIDFIFDVYSDVLADSGNQVFICRAYRKEIPNDPGVAFWLDSRGNEIKHERMGRAVNRNPESMLLSTKVDVEKIKMLHPGFFAVAGDENITISPNENVLTLYEGDTFTEILTAHIPANPKQKVDVYFLADTTGTMTNPINNVQANIASIVATLSGGPVDIAFGAGNYRDFASMDAFQFQHNLSPTTTPASVISAVNSWVIGDGGDAPEGQFFALDRIANTPVVAWRPGAQRIVVWFGDNPGHDPICNALTGLGYDVTEASVTAALQAAQITVLAITVGAYTGLDGAPTAYFTGACGANLGTPGQATRIADATGGTHITGVSASELADNIIEIIESELSELNTVHLVPTGGIVPFVTSINPNEYGPIDLSEPHDLPFTVTFTGVIPCKRKEEQVFNGTIDLVVDGVVMDQKIVQITVPPCEAGKGCEKLRSDADTGLLSLAQEKLFTIPSEGSLCSDILLPGEKCEEVELPEIRPCFLLKWGDCTRDQFETEDFETIVLAVCNPFSNISFGKIHLYNLRVVKDDLSPVENLPDGTPCVMIVPSYEVCVCDIEPCSCAFVELAFKSCGAIEGGYKILFNYCIEEVCMVGVNGEAAIPIELWCS